MAVLLLLTLAPGMACLESPPEPVEPRPEFRQTQEEQAGQIELPVEDQQHPTGYHPGPVRIPPRQAEDGK
ncbi:hypothetical protein [Desulfocurvibacter africanus]|uniref:hypothetical protein n=1 Tax=Desulfocurvibacter africanus TaxID=873 RepID=UPI00041634A9|nr:hypothetical protein [Desulfocurvibacter africanus]